MRRTAVLGVLGASLALAPAAPAATSVIAGKTCYAEGDEIAINGGGFTPGGGVDLTLERGPTVLERSSDPVAEPDGEPPEGPDGSLSGRYGVEEETGWFEGQQTRFSMTLRLVDRTRRDAGQPLESPDVTATTSFIFSRWNVGITSAGGKIRRGRPFRYRAFGYTASIGRPLYAHWVKGRRRVFTKRLGLLRGPCGDRSGRVARGFPFRPSRGRYRVTFNTSRRNAFARASITHVTARVP